MINRVTLLMLFLFSACDKSGNSNVGDTIEKLESLLNRPLYADYEAVLLIPSTGCGGCISSAEEFLLNEYIGQGRSGIFFVIVGYTSRKSAQVKLGSAINHKDVYFDLNGKLQSPEFNVRYPHAFFLKNKNRFTSEEINPSSSEYLYEKLNAITH